MRKLLELTNEISKVSGYKISAQTLATFLYTNNERWERDIKETIPFTTATKRIKYPRINLPKEAKTWTQKTIQFWWEKPKTTQTERYNMFLDWKNQYCKND